MIELTRTLAFVFTIVGGMFSFGHLVIAPAFHCSPTSSAVIWAYPFMIVLGAILYALWARLIGLSITEGFRQFAGMVLIAVVVASMAFLAMLLATVVHYPVSCR